MDEIPEDVLEAADNALNSVRFSSDPYEQVQACARAILAERERCAKVAEAHDYASGTSIAYIIRDGHP